MHDHDASALRARWALDPSIRFLNHGSFGATPRAVLEAQDRYRAELEANPVRFLGRELEGRLDRVRRVLATLLGADAQDVVFVPNATTGVNAVLRSLELFPGDELIVTDHGYNACSNAAAFTAARAGARVVTARIPFPIADPAEAVAAVVGAVTDRTRLALVDHVTSPTGLVLPVERIVPALRERGVATLVDGAHAPGMLPLALDALGADYYTGNCHKWLCAPKGAGFLHVRRELQPGVRPPVISHAANSPRTDRSRFLQEFDWTGTCDPSAVLAVEDALATVGALFPGGVRELMRRNRELALAARELLLGALGVPAPAPPEMIGALVSLPLPDGAGGGRPSAFDVDPLQTALYDEDRIEVPIVPWPAPPRRLVRVSAQAYNALDEYRALAEALRARL